MRLLVVGDRPDSLDERAGGLEGRGEHRAVRLVDLARPELLTRRSQLRASAEDDDGGPAGAENVRDTRRCERSDLRGAKHRACLEQGVTRADVAPGRSHVCPERHGIRHFDPVV